MKAKVKNGQIELFKSLPSTFTMEDGSVIINFKNANKEILKSLGFYDVVKPEFDPKIQTKGALYFDQDNEIVTYDVTDIDFDQDRNIIGEDGKPTGKKEKIYKIDDLKDNILNELKLEAHKRLLLSDWQVVRKLERNIEIDSDVQSQRSAILEELSRKELEVNAITSYIDLLQYDKRFFPPANQ